MRSIACAPAEYNDSSLSIRLAFPLFVVDAYGANKLSKREDQGMALHKKIWMQRAFFSDSHYVTFRTNRGIRE